MVAEPQNRAKSQPLSWGQVLHTASREPVLQLEILRRRLGLGPATIGSQLIDWLEHQLALAETLQAVIAKAPRHEVVKPNPEAPAEYAIHLTFGLGEDNEIVRFNPTPETTSPIAPSAVTDAMVSRFLGWTVPNDFQPDNGVSFDRERLDLNPAHGLPMGTNILDADQARAMLEHVIGQPAPLTAVHAKDPAEAPTWFEPLTVDKIDDTVHGLRCIRLETFRQMFGLAKGSPTETILQLLNAAIGTVAAGVVGEMQPAPAESQDAATPDEPTDLKRRETESLAWQAYVDAVSMIRGSLHNGHTRRVLETYGAWLDTFLDPVDLATQKSMLMANAAAQLIARG